MVDAHRSGRARGADRTGRRRMVTDTDTRQVGPNGVDVGGPVDAVVIGSGPNGLAAAITLARDGRSVHVIEGADTIGGGARTAELTLPGYRHDVCSAIHPFGRISPFFDSLNLDDYGLRWIDPPAPFAHAMDDGPAVVAERSVDETAL